MPNQTLTRDEIKAALTMMIAVADAVKELGSVPEGHLYATLCGHLSAEGFESMMRTLARTGIVSRNNHVVTWVG